MACGQAQIDGKNRYGEADTRAEAMIAFKNAYVRWIEKHPDGPKNRIKDLRQRTSASCPWLIWSRPSNTLASPVKAEVEAFLVI
jgi:hypothetical protein